MAYDWGYFYLSRREATISQGIEISSYWSEGKWLDHRRCSFRDVSIYNRVAGENINVFWLVDVTMGRFFAVLTPLSYTLQNCLLSENAGLACYEALINAKTTSFSSAILSIWSHIDYDDLVVLSSSFHQWNATNKKGSILVYRQATVFAENQDHYVIRRVQFNYTFTMYTYFALMTSHIFQWPSHLGNIG